MSYRIDLDVDESGHIIKVDCARCGKTFSRRGLRTHHASIHGIEK